MRLAFHIATGVLALAALAGAAHAQPANATPKLRHLQAAVGDAIELVPIDALLYLEKKLAAGARGHSTP